MPRPKKPDYDSANNGLWRSCGGKKINSYHYLTTCWPVPAALQTNRRIFAGMPWLRNSDDNVPHEGNL